MVQYYPIMPQIAASCSCLLLRPSFGIFDKTFILFANWVQCRAFRPSETFMKTLSARLFYGSSLLLIFIGSLTLWGQAVSLSLLIGEVGIKALPLLILLEACLGLLTVFAFEQLRGLFPSIGLLAIACGLVIGWIWGIQRWADDRLYYGLLYLAYVLARDLLPFYNWRYLLSYYDIQRHHQLAQLILYSRLELILTGLALILLPFWVDPSQWVGVWLVGIVLYLGLGLLHADEFIAMSKVDAQRKAAWEQWGQEFKTALQAYYDLPLTRYISIASGCLVFVLTLLFYQHLRILDHTAASSIVLMRLFGVSALFSVLVILILWGMGGRLTQRYGAKGLRQAYIALVGSSFGLSYLLPFWPSVFWGELSRQHLYNGFYHPTKLQMNSLLPSSLHPWTHSIGEGLVEPLGRLLAALVLVSWVGLGLPFGLTLVIGAIALWGFGTYYLKAFDLYQSSQEASLAAGQYNFLRQIRPERFLTDKHVIQELIQALERLPDNHRDSLVIGEALAETGDPQCFDALLAYWSNCPSHSLQAELLLLMAEGWTTPQAQMVIQRLVGQSLDSPDPKLRRAALQIIVQYPQLLDGYRVTTLMLDKDPSVSTLACQLLLQHPSAALAKAAQGQLQWLASTGQPRVRALAVDGLVKGGVNRYGERTVILDVDQFQRDSSARVRLGALPAASIAQVISAVQDSSPAVRFVALKRLQQSPLQRPHIAIQKALEAFPVISPYTFQFHQVTGYWHLLGALAALRPRHVQPKLTYHLQMGLKQLDFITSLCQLLNGLGQPSLHALTTQLQLERAHLLHAIIQVISHIYGQQIIQSLTLRLANITQEADYLTALTQLGDYITPPVAQAFARLLGAPRDHTRLVSDTPAWQLNHAPEMMRVLLTQQEDWLSILVLYSLSGLPKSLLEEIANPALITAILDRCQHSSEDALREAIWPIRRLLNATHELPNATPQEDLPMLSTIERMVFLRKVRFFENLRLEQLRTLARICQERSLVEGEVVIQQGDAGDSLMVIVEGTITIADAVGTTLSQHQAGDVLGEISLFDGGVRSATAQASTAALVLVVYREALYNALADDPAIAMDMLRAMAQLVRQTTGRLNTLTSKLTTSQIASIQVDSLSQQ